MYKIWCFQYDCFDEIEGEYSADEEIGNEVKTMMGA